MNNVLVHNWLSGDVYDGVELNSGEFLEPSQQQFYKTWRMWNERVLNAFQFIQSEKLNALEKSCNNQTSGATI